MGEVLSHVIKRMRRIGRISIDTDLVRVALVFEAGYRPSWCGLQSERNLPRMNFV